MLLGVGRKHRHDAVEFCDENRTICFRRAKLFGVDGQFYRSREVYAELGRTIDDAYYVDSEGITGINISPVSKYVQKAYGMMGKYRSKFPNR